MCSSDLLAPKTATVERDGKELQVPVEEVQYTGQQKANQARGRIEQFNKKYGMK